MADDHRDTAITTGAEVDLQTKSLSKDLDEKNVHVLERADSDPVPGYTKEIDPAEVYIPDDSEEFIDPRLKDYPEKLVARTVDLHNDPT